MFVAAKSLAVVAVLVLAGCSSAPPKPVVPPLSAKMVTASLTALVDPNLLIGDDVPLAASVELSGKRTDKVVLLVESSVDGVTWSTVDEVKGAGPMVELATHLVVDAAGPHQFRATVVTAGKKPKVLASSEAQTATVSDVQQMVRRFYYDQTQAYATSTAAGIAFDEKHDYPGFADFKAAAWKTRNKNFTDAAASFATVPALTTVSPDPTWTVAAGPCNNAFVTPPKGRTFIVSVDQTTTSNGFSENAKYDVHLTFLNGQMYHWVACR